jgi:23S rRNA G2445 N2-methylase RlmL
MKVRVTTTIVQELEVPEGWDKFDVFDFLAEYQSFRTAFQGVSNEDQTARIVDLHVVDEIVTEMGEVAYDD